MFKLFINGTVYIPNLSQMAISEFCILSMPSLANLACIEEFNLYYNSYQVIYVIRWELIPWTFCLLTNSATLFNNSPFSFRTTKYIFNNSCVCSSHDPALQFSLYFYIFFKTKLCLKPIKYKVLKLLPFYVCSCLFLHNPEEGTLSHFDCA